MQIGRIEGATRELGKSQGYLSLPVRDEVHQVGDQQFHKIVTAWLPTPEEIEKIVAGAPIHLELLCFTPPPLMMGVGDVPEMS